MKIFEDLESQVRSYSRSFPVVFDKAIGPFLFDTESKKYIDFFCGAGAMSYGHNDPEMKECLLEYLANDGIGHALDMATRAKAEFLTEFESIILLPRKLKYRVQFTGPTGANAVEAALKLARKIRRRSNVVAFTNAYHGLSQGALSVTGNSFYRDEAFINRASATFMPFHGYFGPDNDTVGYLRKYLEDDSSGLDLPAAIIVETIQAEGGINVASAEWLKGLEATCRKYGIILIVDDIQVGCGRTGDFFSFEDAGITPDIVVLSKAISGFGLPMSLMLIRPELDQWKPGEHSGTFRGNNFAFVTATRALRYWESPDFLRRLNENKSILSETLHGIARRASCELQTRGRGMIYGVEIADGHAAKSVAQQCFNRGLIIETCGGSRNVLKLLPPLNVARDVLLAGLEILDDSIKAVCG